MKKIVLVLVAAVMCAGGLAGILSRPVYADTPEMNVLKMCEGTEDTEAIMCVLNLVVNIMTYGIGVLGVVGIVLSGIQYITSQGDPAKMTKAKNRIVNVVIGLVIYAVMYAALVFLVPGFTVDITSSGGGGGGSTTHESSSGETHGGGGGSTTHESSSGKTHSSGGGSF